MRDVAPDGVGRRPAMPLAAVAGELAAEEADWDWEREFKEAIRPIYDDLAASGVIDAVRGFRSYLAMLGVFLSGDPPTPTGNRARAMNAAEPQVGPAGWETSSGRIDALTPGKSETQSEVDRLVVEMIVKEWIAAVLPWIYGLLALFVAWQVARLTFAFMRSRSTRARKRAKTRRRSADSARLRARS